MASLLSIVKCTKNNSFDVFFYKLTNYLLNRCYTTEGVELTRVTVISSDCQVLYETLVKPDNPILDYNTRFSGINEGDLTDVKTTIRDVQAILLSKFSNKTILIGHSFDSDLRALKVNL